MQCPLCNENMAKRISETSEEYTCCVSYIKYQTLPRFYCARCDIEWFISSENHCYGAVFNATKSNWYEVVVSISEEYFFIQEPNLNIILESSFREMSFKDVYDFVNKFDKMRNFK